MRQKETRQDNSTKIQLFQKNIIMNNLLFSLSFIDYDLEKGFFETIRTPAVLDKISETAGTDWSESQ